MTTEELLLLSKKPILLNSTKAWRPYSGGRKIEEWQGVTDPKDSEYPEEWIASTVRARNVGREDIVEGLTTINFEKDKTTYLRDLILLNPYAFLGETHVKKYLNSPAVLTKIIDSQTRLPIQVHPTSEFAKAAFGSSFGKTEAWFIMSTRKAESIEPYLLIGFKRGMTKKKWKELFWKQDIAEMIASLHCIPAKPGEVFLIEGGLPHAIGPGCMLIEVQEPTDYTIRLERKELSGRPIPESFYHQGLGFEKMFDCFNYQPLSYEETLKKYRIQQSILRESAFGKEIELIGPLVTNKFSLRKLEIIKELKFEKSVSFSTLIVVSGKGYITTKNEKAIIQQGNIIFLPANLDDFVISSISERALEIVRCYPPC